MRFPGFKLSGQFLLSLFLCQFLFFSIDSWVNTYFFPQNDIPLIFYIHIYFYYYDYDIFNVIIFLIFNVLLFKVLFLKFIFIKLNFKLLFEKHYEEEIYNY